MQASVGDIELELHLCGQCAPVLHGEQLGVRSARLPQILADDRRGAFDIYDIRREPDGAAAVQTRHRVRRTARAGIRLRRRDPQRPRLDLVALAGHRIGEPGEREAQKQRDRRHDEHCACHKLFPIGLFHVLPFSKEAAALQTSCIPASCVFSSPTPPIRQLPNA